MQKYGERLALLLAASNLEDEIKDSLGSLIPELDLSQLVRLTRLLEISVEEGTKSEIKEFIGAVRTIDTSYKKETAGAKAKAIAELNELTKLL